MQVIETTNQALFTALMLLKAVGKDASVSVCVRGGQTHLVSKKDNAKAFTRLVDEIIKNECSFIIPAKVSNILTRKYPTRKLGIIIEVEEKDGKKLVKIREKGIVGQHLVFLSESVCSDELGQVPEEVAEESTLYIPKEVLQNFVNATKRSRVITEKISVRKGKDKGAILTLKDVPFFYFETL